MIKTIIFDFNRTIFNPEKGFLESGALEVLDKFKNEYKVFLICTGSPGRKKLIEILGLKKYFLKVLVAGKEKQEKHFLYCLKKSRSKPLQAVVVGDALMSEISIGKKLGIITIRLKKGKFAMEEPTRQNKPDYEIKSLLELPSLIAKIERR